MIIRNVKFAFRAFLKRPGYSFITVFGLGIGLACFALITLFVRDELSYDKHHENAEQVYRVSFRGQPPNSEPDFFAVTSSPVGRYLRQDYPEVESVVRLNDYAATILQNGEYYFGETFWFAEPELFDIFTLPIVSGESSGHLVEPFTMVMTQTMAQKYYGDRDPVGEQMVLNDSVYVEITAVIEDLPATSHLAADFFVSYATLLQWRPERDSWLGLGLYTYIKLGDGVEEAAFSEKIKPMVHTYFGEQLDSFGFKAELFLEPLTDIYLKSKIGAQLGPTGDMTQVWVFSAVAIFVLLLACINFTNLATARSMERAREVGVRKALGSTRGALVAQFLAESVFLAMVAFVLALLMGAIALPALNSIAGKEIALSALLSLDMMGILVGFALLSGLLGGAYPALALSSFKSVDVLKGSFHSTRSGAIVRKILVSAQFAISVALIAGTMLVYQQLQFMRGQELGFDQEQMLVIDAQTVSRDLMEQNTDTIISELENLSVVREVSLSGTIPGRPTGRLLFSAEGLEDDDVRSGASLRIGYDYFGNYGIPIIAGRSYSRDFATDLTDAIVINEEMVRYVGWERPEAAIGKMFNDVTVIGVVGDYHHESLKVIIQPSMYWLSPRTVGFVSIRVAGNDASEAARQVREVWASLFPAFPFESFFLDDDFNRLYQSEERMLNIFGIFSFLAILIACLGLFGLAAFTAAQRTKEIGIRKVMGASVPSIVRLLSKEFAYLVLAGFVVAVPATLYGIGKWLEPFPYRISVSWWVFALAGIGALTIALVTVGYQAARAASVDPVRSLRYE